MEFMNNPERPEENPIEPELSINPETEVIKTPGEFLTHMRSKTGKSLYDIAMKLQNSYYHNFDPYRVRQLENPRGRILLSIDTKPLIPFIEDAYEMDEQEKNRFEQLLYNIESRRKYKKPESKLKIMEERKNISIRRKGRLPGTEVMGIEDKDYFGEHEKLDEK